MKIEDQNEKLFIINTKSLFNLNLKLSEIHLLSNVNEEVQQIKLIFIDLINNGKKNLFVFPYKKVKDLKETIISIKDISKIKIIKNNLTSINNYDDKIDNINFYYFNLEFKIISQNYFLSSIELKNLINEDFFNKIFGKSHSDSQKFCFEFCRKKIIKGISIYYDCSLIRGISFILNNNEVYDICLTKEYSKKDTLNIDYLNGEFINKILIRSGDLIDGIEFHTNKNNFISSGGKGGIPYLINLKKGEFENIRYIKGGIKNHLHYILFQNNI